MVLKLNYCICEFGIRTFLIPNSRNFEFLDFLNAHKVNVHRKDGNVSVCKMSYRSVFKEFPPTLPMMGRSGALCKGVNHILHRQTIS